jgi:uncharacterized protein (DUF4415 family)
MKKVPESIRKELVALSARPEHGKGCQSRLNGILRAVMLAQLQRRR